MKQGDYIAVHTRTGEVLAGTFVSQDDDGTIALRPTKTRVQVTYVPGRNISYYTVTNGSTT